MYYSYFFILIALFISFENSQCKNEQGKKARIMKVTISIIVLVSTALYITIEKQYNSQLRIDKIKTLNKNNYIKKTQNKDKIRKMK